MEDKQWVRMYKRIMTRKKEIAKEQQALSKELSKLNKELLEGKVWG